MNRLYKFLIDEMEINSDMALRIAMVAELMMEASNNKPFPERFSHQPKWVYERANYRGSAMVWCQDGNLIRATISCDRQLSGSEWSYYLKGYYADAWNIDFRVAPGSDSPANLDYLLDEYASAHDIKILEVRHEEDI